MQESDPEKSGSAPHQAPPPTRESRAGEPVRLQKYMADAGVASRRKCEEVITGRRVRVNGKVVSELGTKVIPGEDQVMLDGVLIKPRQSAAAYYLFNKPREVMVTAHDPEGRETIYDYLEVPERVVPVGRLDYYSEGLLLLTNDGELAFRLMHPSYGVEKEYHVKLNTPAEEAALERLRKGVEIEGGKTRPATVEPLSDDNLEISVIIQEGKKRQVRQMVNAVGLKVARLIRVREGSLQLGTLRTGKVRKLTKEEIRHLRREVGLPVEEGISARPSGRRSGSGAYKKPSTKPQRRKEQK